MNSKDLFEAKSLNHFKTSNLDIVNSIEFYNANYDNLWNTLAVTRKRSRLKFCIYSFKRCSIDKFLQDLKPRDVLTGQYIHTHPIMLYGAGTFGSGGRGERSVYHSNM